MLLTRAYTTRLAAIVAVLAFLCADAAAAQTSPPAGPAIEIDASLAARWPALGDRIREALDSREDIDRQAKVKLSRRDATVFVEVVLPDGRSTVRSVSRQDVIPTLEALLLMPRSSPAPAALDGSANVTPAPPAPVSPDLSPPRGPEVAPDVRGPAVDDRSVRRLSAARAPGHFRVELSVITGTRIGDGQTGLGVGAFSFLEIWGWLVGFQGRVDWYRSLDGASSDGAIELAPLGGRRFRFDGMALDLAMGPAAVVQGTSGYERKSVATGAVVSGSSSSTAPRLVLGARLSFSERSTLHTFVGVDGEVGPVRAGGYDLPGASRLPIWTAGLAFGATVGTP